MEVGGFVVDNRRPSSCNLAKDCDVGEVGVVEVLWAVKEQLLEHNQQFQTDYRVAEAVLVFLHLLYDRHQAFSFVRMVVKLDNELPQIWF